MSARHTLPPPIVDPVTGKTYVAIRTNPLLAAGGRSRESIGGLPGLVYVEKGSESDSASEQGCGKLKRPSPTLERPKLKTKREAQGIKLWAEKNAARDAPPGHVPWESPLSMAESNNRHFPPEFKKKPLFTISSSAKSIRSHMPRQDSAFTIELPSFTSMESLMRLPMSSSLSSGFLTEISVPPFCEVKERRRQNSSPLVTIRPPRESSTSVDFKGKRYTVCFANSTTNSNREVAVFPEPQSTAKKKKRTSKASSQPPISTSIVSDVMAHIYDLKKFYSEGLKKMDCTIKHLSLEQRKLDTPSLVVSTSDTVLPLALESSSNLDRAVSLATRRGKCMPSLLELPEGKSDFKEDYPDLSSPFDFKVDQEFTDNEHLFFDSIKIHADFAPSHMTTRQMVSSLHERVKAMNSCDESFSADFNGQWEEAEAWLISELAAFESSKTLGSEDVVTKILTKSGSLASPPSLSPPRFPLPDIPIFAPEISPIESSGVEAFEKVKTHGGMNSPDRPPPLEVVSWQVREGAEKKPTLVSSVRVPDSSRKAIGSDGDGLSGQAIRNVHSAKKVRFSEQPPVTIPVVKEEVLGQGSTTGRNSKPSSPNNSPSSRRKPPPTLESPTSRRKSQASKRNSRLSTPLARPIGNSMKTQSAAPNGSRLSPSGIPRPEATKVAITPRPFKRRFTEGDHSLNPSSPALSIHSTTTYLPVASPMLSGRDKPLPNKPLDDKENVGPPNTITKPTISTPKVLVSSKMSDSNPNTIGSDTKRESKPLKTRSLPFRVLSRFRH